MGLVILFVIGILAGAYLLLFSVNNTQQISLDLWIAGQFLHDVPVWQLVVACLAIGSVITLFLMLPAQFRAAGKTRACRNELRRTQAMLEEERKRAAVIDLKMPPPVPTAQAKDAAGEKPASAEAGEKDS
jgi:uncharacterized integral membrane protein